MAEAENAKASGENCVCENFDAPILDKQNWLTYHDGSAPILISAPHGGLNFLDDVPKREDAEGNKLPGSTHCTDGWTRAQAMELHQALRDKFGVDVSLLATEFRRPHVDLNRGIDDQAKDYELNDRGKELWNAYHNKIKEYQKKWEGQKSFLIDLHAQGRHDIVMLGLGIWQREADPNLKTLFDTKKLNESQSKDFTLNADCKENLYEAVYGDSSFGNILQAKMKNDIFAEKPSVISPCGSTPICERYLRGGYIVRMYRTDTLCGVQVESPRYLRQDTEIRQAYVARMAETIFDWCKANGVKIPQ